MTEDRGLTEALRRRADQLGTTRPLTLDDVQGRARGIRRRRTALSGLAAAAVLAVAAPVGLSLGDTPEDPGRTPTVASTGVKDGVLTTDVDAEGGEPGIPYLYAGQVHLPDGVTVPVAGDWTGFDTLGDGFVVSDGSRLAVLDADGDVVVETATSGAVFAVSPDHTLVAHVSDGRLEALDSDGDTFRLPVPEDIQSPQVVGVDGSGSCDPASTGGGCVFLLNDSGMTPRAYSVTSKGIVNPLGRFLSLSDVSDDGWVSGITAIDEVEPSTCNEVWRDPFGDSAEWRTCRWRPTEFSHDGSLVVGAPSYGDGVGDGSLAMLGTADGKVLAEWRNSEANQAWVTATAWDADGTVLGMVSEGERSSLMRFHPDGGLSKVMDVEGTYAGASALLLPMSS